MASKFTGETAPPEVSVNLAGGVGEGEKPLQGVHVRGGPVTPPHVGSLPLFNLERRFFSFKGLRHSDGMILFLWSLSIFRS